ncbi:MAG: NIPSNAP family protein [Bacteroidota bacterium]
MQRRKFIASAAAASTLPLSAVAVNQSTNQPTTAEEKELYELRTYHLKWGGNQQLLLDYLKDALKPAMLRAGSNHFILFNSVAPDGPKKLYALISYPNMATYLGAQNLNNDRVYAAAAIEYSANLKTIYNRYESWLLHAFDAFPVLQMADDLDAVFELRTYESSNEDALRRKIKMFNEEEVPIFKDAGLEPVFFAEMLAGPYRPALTYMIHTKDMATSVEGWKNFLKHPDWNRIKVMSEYANTVSNIRNVFLQVAG